MKHAENPVRCETGDLQWVRIPPDQSVARLEATRVTREAIHAEHREGMLYLHLPKHKEPPRKAIHIKVE